MDIESYKQKKAELEEMLSTHASRLIEQLFEPFLKRHKGKIEKIGWTQYTPYFNDGDACVFSVHQPGYKIVGDNMDEDDGYDEEYYIECDMYYIKTKHPELAEDVSEFEETFFILEDVLESAFGDGVKVEAFLNGDDSIEFEAEEYHHD